MCFPSAGSLGSILELCPFVRIVDLYVLVGLAAPVLLVHKGQICLNAGTDKGNPLLLQSLALALLQVCASDMTVGIPDSSTRLAWIRLRSGSPACHDTRMIKKDARRYFACITVMAGRSVGWILSRSGQRSAVISRPRVSHR